MQRQDQDLDEQELDLDEDIDEKEEPVKFTFEGGDVVFWDYIHDGSNRNALANNRDEILERLQEPDHRSLVKVEATAKIPGVNFYRMQLHDGGRLIFVDYSVDYLDNRYSILDLLQQFGRHRYKRSILKQPRSYVERRIDAHRLEILTKLKERSDANFSITAVEFKKDKKWKQLLYSKKIMFVSAKQESYAYQKMPLFFIGMPGAAKSLALITHLENNVCLIKNKRKKILVSTKENLRMLNELIKAWRDSSVYNKYKQMVEFKLGNDVNSILLPDDEYENVGEDHFKTWFKDYYSAFKKQPERKTEFLFLSNKDNYNHIYQELTLISPMDLEDYLSLGEGRTYYDDPIQRRWLWQVVKSYKEYLVTKREGIDELYSDPAFSASSKKDLWEYAYIEEGHNLFLQEMVNIALGANGNVVIVIDNKQDKNCIKSKRFLFEMVLNKQLKKENLGRVVTTCVLNKNRRRGDEALPMINKVLFIHAAFSEDDKYGYKTIKETGKKEGNIFWTESEDAHTENDKKMLAYLDDKKELARFVILAEKEYHKAMQDRFGTKVLILEPGASQGLEFDFVLCRGLFKKDIYRQLGKIVEEINFEDSARVNKSRIEHKVSDEMILEVRKVLNWLTRHKRYCFIWDETGETGKNQNAFVAKLHEFASVFNLNNEITQKSTETELENLVITLIQNGNIESAEEQWVGRLGRKKEDFGPFVKKHTIEEMSVVEDEVTIEPEEIPVVENVTTIEPEKILAIDNETIIEPEIIPAVENEATAEPEKIPATENETVTESEIIPATDTIISSRSLLLFQAPPATNPKTKNQPINHQRANSTIIRDADELERRIVEYKKSQLVAQMRHFATKEIADEKLCLKILSEIETINSLMIDKVVDDMSFLDYLGKQKPIHLTLFLKLFSEDGMLIDRMFSKSEFNTKVKDNDICLGVALVIFILIQGVKRKDLDPMYKIVQHLSRKTVTSKKHEIETANKILEETVATLTNRVDDHRIPYLYYMIVIPSGIKLLNDILQGNMGMSEKMKVLTCDSICENVSFCTQGTVKTSDANNENYTHISVLHRLYATEQAYPLLMSLYLAYINRVDKLHFVVTNKLWREEAYEEMKSSVPILLTNSIADNGKYPIELLRRSEAGCDFLHFMTSKLGIDWIEKAIEIKDEDMPVFIEENSKEYRLAQSFEKIFYSGPAAISDEEMRLMLDCMVENENIFNVRMYNGDFLFSVIMINGLDIDPRLIQALVDDEPLIDLVAQKLNYFTPACLKDGDQVDAKLMRVLTDLGTNNEWSFQLFHAVLRKYPDLYFSYATLFTLEFNVMEESNDVTVESKKASSSNLADYYLSEHYPLIIMRELFERVLSKSSALSDSQREHLSDSLIMARIAEFLNSEPPNETLCEEIILGQNNLIDLFNYEVYGEGSSDKRSFLNFLLRGKLRDHSNMVLEMIRKNMECLVDQFEENGLLRLAKRKNSIDINLFGVLFWLSYNTRSFLLIDDVFAHVEKKKDNEPEEYNRLMSQLIVHLGKAYEGITQLYALISISEGCVWLERLIEKYKKETLPFIQRTVLNIFQRQNIHSPRISILHMMFALEHAHPLLLMILGDIKANEQQETDPIFFAAPYLLLNQMCPLSTSGHDLFERKETTSYVSVISLMHQSEVGAEILAILSEKKGYEWIQDAVEWDKYKENYEIAQKMEKLFYSYTKNPEMIDLFYEIITKDEKLNHFFELKMFNGKNLFLNMQLVGQGAKLYFSQFVTSQKNFLDLIVKKLIRYDDEAFNILYRLIVADVNPESETLGPEILNAILNDHRKMLFPSQLFDRKPACDKPSMREYLSSALDNKRKGLWITLKSKISKSLDKIPATQTTSTSQIASNSAYASGLTVYSQTRTASSSRGGVSQRARRGRR